MNIDFLRVGTHSKTEDYLGMLYSTWSYLHINGSTDQIIPGIVTMDISDPLPTFCFIRRRIARLKPKRFFSDYSNFDSETYDIKSADWSSILNDPTNIHTKAGSFVEKLKGIANKHAPIKRITRSRLKQKIHKPWITDTLLNSIRNKQKMYRTHFLSKDLDKVAYYKKYPNTLSKLKWTCTSSYYKQQFENYLVKVSDIHSHNTRYASNLNFHVPRLRSNYGKHTFEFATKIKTLSYHKFKKEYKRILVNSQR